MAFPWDNLISAAAGVGGGLSVAWLTGHFNLRQARLARINDRSDRQDATYVTLVVTARRALRHQRQLRMAYSRSEYWNDPGAREVILGGDAIANDLSQAIAQVELTGSHKAREGAKAILKDARTSSTFFLDRSIVLTAAKTPRAKRALRPFDMVVAAEKCDALEVTIERFIDITRNQAGLTK